MKSAKIHEKWHFCKGRSSYVFKHKIANILINFYSDFRYFQLETWKVQYICITTCATTELFSTDCRYFPAPCHNDVTPVSCTRE